MANIEFYSLNRLRWDRFPSYQQIRGIPTITYKFKLLEQDNGSQEGSCLGDLLYLMRNPFRNGPALYYEVYLIKDKDLK
jgi:hypothetical protein